MSKSRLIQKIGITIIIPSLFILNACDSNTEKSDPSININAESPTPTRETNKEVLSIEDTQKIESEKDAPLPFVKLGSYTIDNPTSLNNGLAEVTYKGNGIYHLSVNVVRGISFNNGSIDADFEIQEDTPMFSEEYEQIKLSFQENKLIIDYPDDIYGGMNAEPKGIYYLNNHEMNQNNEFIQKIYNSTQLSYDKNDQISVIAENENIELMLIEKFHNDNLEESIIVLYNVESEEVVYYNSIDISTYTELKEKLQAYNFNDYQIYFAIHRVYYNRYMDVLLDRIDNNTQTNTLSDKEAFYIATGLKNKTYYENNTRDENDIGSIFIQEIDSSNEEEAIIHIYELVRNDPYDQHTATMNWITVNKETGMVTTFFD